MTVRIALETSGEAAAIRALLPEAFPTALEADLVERLRRDGDIALGIVARDVDAVVGHAVFSPMTAPIKALPRAGRHEAASPANAMEARARS